MPDDELADELAAMRAKAQALTHAAEASSLQTALAANVRERMERIDSIMAMASPEVDEEVEAWRCKIDELSQPVTGESAPQDTTMAAPNTESEAVPAPAALASAPPASAPREAPPKDAPAGNTEAVPTCIGPSCSVM